VRFGFDIEIAAFDAVLLICTWMWVLRRSRNFPSLRQKAAVLGLVSATAAASLHLMLTVIRHSPQINAPEVYFRALEMMGGLAIVGIFLGAVGKGTARIAALCWSVFIFGLCVLIFGTSGH
jgi:hypothetical protein